MGAAAVALVRPTAARGPAPQVPLALLRAFGSRAMARQIDSLLARFAKGQAAPLRPIGGRLRLDAEAVVRLDGGRARLGLRLVLDCTDAWALVRPDRVEAVLRRIGAFTLRAARRQAAGCEFAVVVWSDDRGEIPVECA